MGLLLNMVISIAMLVFGRGFHRFWCGMSSPSRAFLELKKKKRLGTSLVEKIAILTGGDLAVNK